MTYRVLVPFDGSEPARRAIPWADEIAGALKADVQLMTVVPTPVLSSISSDDVHDYFFEAECAEARLRLTQMRARFRGSETVELHVAHGPAAETIVSQAKGWPANLVLMATHGHSNVARALLGSVASSVIRESGIPVLVIRPELLASPHVPRRVLVPLDGSELAAAVIPAIVPLAKALEWSLVLFAATELSPPRFGIDGGVTTRPTAEVGEYLEQTSQELAREGVAADVEVSLGGRLSSIAEAALRQNCGLVATSAHGRDGLGIGGLADSALRQAEIPVLAVRPLQPALGEPIKLESAFPHPATEVEEVSLRLTRRQTDLARFALSRLGDASTLQSGTWGDVQATLRVLDVAAGAHFMAL